MAGKRRVKDDLRSLMLAGFGALAMAKDEAEKAAKRLVARGEIAEKEARAILDRVAGKPMEAAKKAGHKAGAAVEDGLHKVLSKLRIPTRDDIASLGRRIDALSEKLEKHGKRG